MSVYVDRDGAMIADELQELKKMHRRLGSTANYAEAVRLGAIQVSKREFQQKMAEIEYFGYGFGPDPRWLHR